MNDSLYQLEDLQTIRNLPKKSVRNETGNMTLDLMLPERSIKERLNLFFDFCDVFEEKDHPVLKANPKQFSHPLHWDDIKSVQQYRQYKDRHGIEKTFELGVIHSFCGENDDLLTHMVGNGSFDNWKGPLVRGDLFQIWWPKGINTREFIWDNHSKISNRLFEQIENGETSIVPLYKGLVEYVKELHPRFVRSSYANKNFVRHMAMAFPDIIDAESYINPGTGSFRGFQQIFAGDILISTASLATKDDDPKLLQIKEQFKTIQDHPRNPFNRQHNINIEDKVCFFFKWLAIQAGWMKGKTKYTEEKTLETFFG